jgi:organic radical activating enzyme
MNKTYCAYPFVNLYVANFNQVMPCCNFLEPPQTDSVENFFDSEWMNNIRQDMLQGKCISGCESCYNKEAAGLISERQQANEEFGIVTEPKLIVLDFMLDNICNLKCRMCTSGYSHNWYADEKLLYGRTLSPTKYLKNTLTDTVNLHNLQRIVFQGGEPLYSPKFEPMLDRLDNENTIENIELWMTTNATIMPTKKIKKYIQRFKTVALTVSLDGTDKLFNYIRKNAEFNKVKSVLDYYHSIINETISVTINCTINVYNANEIDNIQSYYRKNYPKFVFNENFVTYPRELNIQNTPDNFKLYINNNITNKKVLQWLNEPGENLFDYFVHYTQELDVIRKESIKNANPWLYNYIKSYKVNKTLDDAKEYWNNFMDMIWDKNQ